MDMLAKAHRRHLAERAGLRQRVAEGGEEGDCVPEGEQSVALYIRVRFAAAVKPVDHSIEVFSIMDTLSVPPFVHKLLEDDAELIVGVEPVATPKKAAK